MVDWPETKDWGSPLLVVVRIGEAKDLDLTLV
jgi:hypothetical protein